jgi:hypothetical protein
MPGGYMRYRSALDKSYVDEIAGVLRSYGIRFYRRSIRQPTYGMEIVRKLQLLPNMRKQLADAGTVNIVSSKRPKTMRFYEIWIQNKEFTRVNKLLKANQLHENLLTKEARKRIKRLNR